MEGAWKDQFVGDPADSTGIGKGLKQGDAL